MTEPPDEPWEILPALRLPRGVLFPGTRGCVVLENVAAYGAVMEATRSWDARSLAVFAARPQPAEPGGEPAPYTVGTLAEVVTLQRPTCCNRWVADLRAISRLRMAEQMKRVPFLIARTHRLEEPPEDADLLLGLVTALKETSHRLAALAPDAGGVRRALALLTKASEPAPALGHAVQLLPDLSIEEQQRILELPRTSDRLSHVIQRMHERIARGWRPHPRVFH
jgi:ATP-dependent Lon protease